MCFALRFSYSFASIWGALLLLTSQLSWSSDFYPDSLDPQLVSRYLSAGELNLTFLVVTNSGGSLADIWPQSHRSIPFALFTTGSSLGPVVAPIVGGFISQVSGYSKNICKVARQTDLSEVFKLEMVSFRI